MHEQRKMVITELAKVLAKSVPAAAATHTVRALFGIIGCKGQVGGH